MITSQEWVRTRSGGIARRKLIDAGVMAVSSGILVMRVEYADNRTHAAEIAADKAEPKHLQVGLSLKQVDRLIEELTRVSAKLRRTTSQQGALN